jgi:predicted kinase
MFIVLAGLPGSGKSTIAQRLASEIKATYLRVDSIEQAIRSSSILPLNKDMGPAGYMAVCRVAADNLRLGNSVIADSVNPLGSTRAAYREIAERLGVRFVEVEIICSDLAVHRHRIETRRSTVEGLVLPTWKEVETRQYEAWDHPHLHIDTAHLSVEQSVMEIITVISAPDPRGSCPKR